MKIIDISQEIYQGMPVYPGDPTFQSHRVNSFKQGDMCEVSEVTMGTHCGTHIDAPTHMVPDGKPLESFPLDCFIGPCRVLNVPYPVISEKALQELNVQPGERILLRTDPNGKYNKHARFNPSVLSMRAAQYIAAKRGGAPEEGFEQAAAQALEQMGALARRALQPQGNVRALWAQAARRMSECGAAIRDGGAIAVYLAEVKAQLASFERNVTASEAAELRWVYRLRDMLISQYAYLAAMLDYMQQGGKSRGSALYTDPAGKKPYAQLPDAFTFVLDDGSRGGRVQEMLYRDGACVFEWRPVRPIPKDDDFFENVWREYRETGNVG